MNLLDRAAAITGKLLNVKIHDSLASHTPHLLLVAP
jgi:hypothetical protein